MENMNANLTAGMKLERDYFTPAIQQAMKKALQDEYSAVEIISGVANAYMHMLKMLFYRDEAVTDFLAAQADHVANAKKNRLH